MPPAASRPSPSRVRSTTGADELVVTMVDVAWDHAVPAVSDRYIGFDLIGS
jgi:hypothetical protein